MTADAKVGLLLGLAFIVIIAFLINGLPNFWDSSRSQTGLESELTNLSGSGYILEEQARQAVRNVNLRESAPPKKERATVELNTDDTVDIQPVKPENQVSGNTESDKATVAMRTHIVKSGDSLGSIAKQAYGKILGNKLDIVNQIYLANKNTLASPNDIKVGQELAIPDLFTEVKSVAPAKTENPDPGMFEAIRNKIIPPKPQYRIYTVRNKDSLWAIAQKQLANGNRYHEILKLNNGTIKSAGDLVPGMKLKLPNL